MSPRTKKRRPGRPKGSKCNGPRPEPFANEAAILRVLIEEGRRVYGFEIAKKSGVNEGSYLLTLKRLIERGLVTEGERVGKNRIFEVTKKGHEVLVAYGAFKDALEGEKS